MRVVDKDRTECAGDENVLLPPPSVFAAVALVPAFELPASLRTVSPVVDNRVGARDLIARVETCSLSRESSCGSDMILVTPEGLSLNLGESIRPDNG